MASRPDEYLVIVGRISDKNSQDDSGARPLDGRHFMDAAGVKKVEVSLLQIDLIVLYTVVSGVSVKGLFGNIRLNLLRPEAPMQDSLRAFSVFIGILDAQYTCELVLETVNGIVCTLLPVFNVINMWFVAMCFVVDTENRGAVTGAIGFTCNLHLFSGRKGIKRLIDEINRVIKSIK